MTAEADNPGEITFSEEYLDAAAVTLFGDSHGRYIARQGDGGNDTPCAVVVVMQKRQRPSSRRTRPPAPPVVKNDERGRLALVPVPTLPSTTDESDPLPTEYDTALKADAAHIAARLRYRAIWNEVYGLQRDDQHRRRVLDLIDANNAIAAAASVVAFRLGLQVARSERLAQTSGGENSG